MALDFSRIAGAMNTFSNSPAAKKSNKSNVNIALLTQELEEKSRADQLASYQQMMTEQEDMLKVARSLAIRPKDRGRIEQVVRNAGAQITDKINNDFSGNLDHFYRAMGPEYMDSIRLDMMANLKDVEGNVGEYTKFLQAQKDGRPMFHTTLNREFAYSQGTIDKFVFGSDMINWETPDQSYINKQIGEQRVDVFLSFQDNAQIMTQNMAIEKNLTPDEINSITDEDLRKYSNAYFGGVGDFGKIKGAKPKAKISKEIQENLFNLGVHKAKDILNLDKKGTSFYSKQTTLKEIAKQTDELLSAEYSVYGKQAFVGQETQIAEAFLGAEGYTEDLIDVTVRGADNAISIPTLYSTEKSGVFDVTGVRMQGAIDTDEAEFNVISVVQAYKTVDGNELITSEDISTSDKNVKPVYVAVLKDQGNLFGFGDEVFYKEIDFTNSIDVTKYNNLVKYDDEQYNKNIQEQGEQLRSTNEKDAFVNLSVASSPQKLSKFVAYNDLPLSESLRYIGATQTTPEMKAAILALAYYSGNTESYLENNISNFTASSQPELNELILANDRIGFLQAIEELYIAQGNDEKKVRGLMAQIGQYAEALYNSNKK